MIGRKKFRKTFDIARPGLHPFGAEGLVAERVRLAIIGRRALGKRRCELDCQLPVCRRARCPPHQGKIIDAEQRQLRRIRSDDRRSRGRDSRRQRCRRVHDKRCYIVARRDWRVRLCGIGRSLP